MLKWYKYQFLILLQKKKKKKTNTLSDLAGIRQNAKNHFCIIWNNSSAACPDQSPFSFSKNRRSNADADVRKNKRCYQVAEATEFHSRPQNQIKYVCLILDKINAYMHIWYTMSYVLCCHSQQFPNLISYIYIYSVSFPITTLPVYQQKN